MINYIQASLPSIFGISGCVVLGPSGLIRDVCLSRFGRGEKSSQPSLQSTGLFAWFAAAHLFSSHVHVRICDSFSIADLDLLHFEKDNGTDSQSVSQQRREKTP